MNIDNNHQYYKTFTNSIREFCVYFFGIFRCWIELMLLDVTHKANGLNRKRLRAIYDFSYRFEGSFFKKKKIEKNSTVSKASQPEAQVSKRQLMIENIETKSISSLLLFNSICFECAQKREKTISIRNWCYTYFSVRYM